jgi:N-methylhydantoinase A
MLASPLRGEAVRTVVGPLDMIGLATAFAGVEDAALAELGESRDSTSVEIARYAELRYAGQEHTLEVPVPDPAVRNSSGPNSSGPNSSGLDEIRAAFERRCLDSYSFKLDAPLEVVALRVSATEPAPEISWTDTSTPGELPSARARLVDLDPYGPPEEVPVLVRAELAGGQQVVGPCVIEEPAATTLVLPGQAARQDEAGNLILEERS